MLQAPQATTEKQMLSVFQGKERNTENFGRGNLVLGLGGMTSSPYNQDQPYLGKPLFNFPYMGGAQPHLLSMFIHIYQLECL